MPTFSTSARAAACCPWTAAGVDRRRQTLATVRAALVPPGRTARDPRPCDRLSSPVWIRGSAAIPSPRWRGRACIPAIASTVAAAKKGEAAAKSNDNFPEPVSLKDSSPLALQNRLTALENASTPQSKIGDDHPIVLMEVSKTINSALEASIHRQKEKIHSLEATNLEVSRKIQTLEAHNQELQAELANHVEMRNKMFKGKFICKVKNDGDNWSHESGKFIIGGRLWHCQSKTDRRSLYHDTFSVQVLDIVLTCSVPEGYEHQDWSVRARYKIDLAIEHPDTNKLETVASVQNAATRDMFHSERGRDSWILRDITDSGRNNLPEWVPDYPELHITVSIIIDEVDGVAVSSTRDKSWPS